MIKEFSPNPLIKIYLYLYIKCLGFMAAIKIILNIQILLAMILNHRQPKPKTQCKYPQEAQSALSEELAPLGKQAPQEEIVLVLLVLQGPLLVLQASLDPLAKQATLEQRTVFQVTLDLQD
jgi:hypothetical protein